MGHTIMKNSCKPIGCCETTRKVNKGEQLSNISMLEENMNVKRLR